jgi:hypothetical protein
MEIETVKVKRLSDGAGPIIINKSDYDADPDGYELLSEKSKGEKSQAKSADQEPRKMR